MYVHPAHKLWQAGSQQCSGDAQRRKEKLQRESKQLGKAGESTVRWCALTVHNLESSIAALWDCTRRCSGASEVTIYHGSFSPLWCTNVPLVSMSRAEICFRMPAALSDAGMPVMPKPAVMSVAT